MGKLLIDLDETVLFDEIFGDSSKPPARENDHKTTYCEMQAQVAAGCQAVFQKYELRRAPFPECRNPRMPAKLVPSDADGFMVADGQEPYQTQSQSKKAEGCEQICEMAVHWGQEA